MVAERIWLFTERRWKGALDVARGLTREGIPARLWTWTDRPPRSGILVCWGQEVPEGWDLEGVKIINSSTKFGKAWEHEHMASVGIPVPGFSRTPVEGWHGRRDNHQKGHDFTEPPRRPAYWVEHLDLVLEYRVHVWMGKVLRIGMRSPMKRFNGNHHPWVRSAGTGWGFKFRGAWRDAVPEGVRRWAKEAVASLGLDFGAVDMAVARDGRVYVLEVNRAPGLEPRTIEKYVEKLKEVANGGD